MSVKTDGRKKGEGAMGRRKMGRVEVGCLFGTVSMEFILYITYIYTYITWKRNIAQWRNDCDKVK